MYVDEYVYVFICLEEGFISVCWVVICYASDIIEYDRRR